VKQWLRAAAVRRIGTQHGLRAAAALAVVAPTGLATGANRAGLLGIRTVASTPRAAAEGKVWLLATSAFVADTPTAPSLIAFAVLALAAVYVCGLRVAAVSAAVAHVGSAAAMYALIAVVRAVAPTAFESVLTLPDYGLSAIFAAWLGAVAAVGWRARAAAAPRSGIAAFCLFAGFVGWLCRPDLTPLDFEHVLAFGLGIAVVSARAWPYARRVVGEWARLAREAVALTRRVAAVAAVRLRPRRSAPSTR
jgi:hypothetical protein